MIVKKQELKKKLLKQFDNEEIHSCGICGQTIARYDITDYNFEYVKNYYSENYAHTKCVDKMIKKVK